MEEELGGFSAFEVNRLETLGASYAIQGCNVTNEFGLGAYIYIEDEFITDPSGINVNDVLYDTEDNLDPFNGQNKFYGLRVSGSSTDATHVFRINSSGVVTEKYSCDGIGTYSVSGSIPYVDYYAGNFYMYKTGSQHYSSIEGAVSQSCMDFGITFSGSNFNEFISQSLPDAFDEDITGVITDVIAQISSSLQFQGYPVSGGVGPYEP